MHFDRRNFLSVWIFFRSIEDPASNRVFKLVALAIGLKKVDTIDLKYCDPRFAAGYTVTSEYVRKVAGC